MADEIQKNNVTLKDYLLIIFARRKFFLIPFLIIFFTASIGSFFLPKYYKSTAIIKVEEQKPINPLVERERYIPASEEITLTKRIKTLTEEILSYERLLTLIRNTGLDRRITDVASFEDMIKGLRQRVEIKMKSPDIFSVAYEDKDPKMAEKVVNTLIYIFIEENKEEKKEEARIGVDYAENQAKLYKQKLEEAEETLQDFREKHSLQLPGKELDMNVQMLVNFQTDLARVRMDILNLQDEMDKIERQLAGEQAVIISENMTDLNPIVVDLNNQLQDIKRQLDVLLLEDPNSEDVYELQLALEDTRQRLQDEIEKHVDAETINTNPLFYQRLKNRLDNARQRMKELTDREKELMQLVNLYEGRMKTLPEQEAEYSRLSRDVEVNEQIYKMLKLKAEESRLTAKELEQRGIDYELIENGRLPLKPSKPQKLLIAVVALLLGTIGGVGSVFIAEFADRSFKNTEDALGYMKVPYLGSVSRIVTQQEIRRARIKRVLFNTLMVILTLGIIAAGIITTYQENKKASEKLKEQEKLEEVEL